MQLEWRYVAGAELNPQFCQGKRLECLERERVVDRPFDPDRQRTFGVVIELTDQELALRLQLQEVRLVGELLIDFLSNNLSVVVDIFVQGITAAAADFLPGFSLGRRNRDRRYRQRGDLGDGRA